MDWTVDEERKLYAAVLRQRDALNWSDIASNFTNVTAVECEDRWKEILKRGMIRGSWCQEEDEIITKAVNEGTLKWSDVASLLHNLRTGKQCRERWTNHLDPSLRKVPWTEEEDNTIMEGQTLYGNSWTRISKLLNGRSENEVKNRWYSVLLKRNQRNMPPQIAPPPPPVIGQKRKLNDGSSEITNIHQSSSVEAHLNHLRSHSIPVYTEADYNQLLQEVQGILKNSPHYQNYSDFDTIFKTFIPHNKVYQEMANLYLNSILVDYPMTTTNDFSEVRQKESEGFLQMLSPNSIALLKKSSSSQDLNETTSINSRLFSHITPESSSVTSPYQSLGHDLAVQSLMKLHVSSGSAPASPLLTSFSQSTSPLWMEYGFVSMPSSPTSSKPHK